MPPRNKGFSLRLSFSVQLCKQKPAIALQNWTDLPYPTADPMLFRSVQLQGLSICPASINGTRGAVATTIKGAPPSA